MEHDSGAILARTHRLPGGERVRLRLARARDEERLRALLRRSRGDHGADAGALAHFDPRHEVVVCATSLVGSSQEVIGVGAVDLDGAQPPEVVIDEGQNQELAELLRLALNVRVRARRRR
jgi:hypothetical protein